MLRSVAALLLGGLILAPLGPLHDRADVHVAEQTPSMTVAEVDYDLGEESFSSEAYPEERRSEVAAHVWLPLSDTTEQWPVVFMLHGYWVGCSDPESWATYQTALEAAGMPTALDNDATRFASSGDPLPESVVAAAGAYYEKAMAWPCQGDTMHSNLGLGYIAQSLASDGIAVVSIAADGLNNLTTGSGGSVRSDLINLHLELWAELVASGTGRLADALSAQGVALADLRKVDMERVGTLGHSRGGGGVINQASEALADDVPAGVHVLATAAVAPAWTGRNFPDREDVLDLPGADRAFLLIGGTCDSIAAASAGQITRLDPLTSSTRRHDWLAGANHNFFNTRWSPSSGMPSATDDALHPPLPNESRLCLDRFDAQDSFVPQLDETRQREELVSHLRRFFTDTLLTPYGSGSGATPSRTGASAGPTEAAQLAATGSSPASWIGATIAGAMMIGGLSLIAVRARRRPARSDVDPGRRT